MAWRVGQEMTPILVTGCNNSNKGFTLIEILVVLIIISIASSFIFINLSSIESVSKNQSSFNKSFNYISEESIITGSIIGWHANNDKEFFYSIDTDNQIISNIKNPYQSNWDNLKSYKKTFKSPNGLEIDFDLYEENIPLILFYPSGESSGGVINIFLNDYIQEIEINSNGKVASKNITY